MMMLGCVDTEMADRHTQIVSPDAFINWAAGERESAQATDVQVGVVRDLCHLLF